MARKRYAQTESVIDRFIHEGRGLGTGAEYKPWLEISDVPSRGRCHRPFCLKTGREHHLLSDNEYNAYLIQCWDDNVIDIREQYPLIDRRETMQIAALCGIRHPVDPNSGTTLVITTDLLVTLRTPDGTTLVAYTAKEEKDLKNPRTLEKLEIERIFWARRDVPWRFFVSTNLRNNFTNNLAWIIDPGPDVPSNQLSRQLDEIITPYLLEAIYKQGESPVRSICLSVDTQLNLSQGRTLRCLRQLLAAKYIFAPLDVPRIQDLPGSAFFLGDRKHDYSESNTYHSQ
jgi:hypothetical protein